jgi:hypothetical protein
MKAHRWVEATPVSSPREESPVEEPRQPRRVDGARRGWSRRLAGEPPPAPRPVRDLTPEELARVDELHDAGLVRVKTHPRRDNLRAAPCACSETVACALHQAVRGRPHPRPIPLTDGHEPER